MTTSQILGGVATLLSAANAGVSFYHAKRFSIEPSDLRKFDGFNGWALASLFAFVIFLG